MPNTERDPYTYLYDPYIAPPPPKRSRWKTFMIIAWILIIIGGACVIYVLDRYTQSDTPIVRKIPIDTATTIRKLTIMPTPMPTVNPDYTAMDIYNDFRESGLIRSGTLTEEPITIWSWSSDNYFVSIHSTSSISWSDDSGCSGYCSPANLGLWVYQTGIAAQNVANQVGSDESTIGSIPMMGIPNIYVGGRCVLLSNDSHQINESYISVMQNNCI